MEGDDRTRFCQLCKLNVYDISQLTKNEAEKLIRESSGRLCMRLHQRADGRVITSDCPVGLAAMRKRILYMVAGAAAIALAAVTRASTFWISGGSPEDSDFGQMVTKSKERILATGIFGKKPKTVTTAPVGRVTTGIMILPVHHTPRVPVTPPPGKHPSTP